MTKEEALQANPECKVSHTENRIRKDEQETHISEVYKINIATSSKTAHISRLFKQGWNPTNILINKTTNNVIEATFEAPIDSFIIKKAERIKREKTPEQKREMEERMKKLWKTRNKNN